MLQGRALVPIRPVSSGGGLASSDLGEKGSGSMRFSSGTELGLPRGTMPMLCEIGVAWSVLRVGWNKQ